MGAAITTSIFGQMNTINASHYGIQAATCNNITYVRNYKCASSFFFYNFVNTYGWQEINYNDIDWTNSKVFAHIIDPIDRRHKGIAHWINYHLDCDINDVRIAKLIKNISFLDNHSASYWDTFGENCYKIDWIPIDIFDNKKVIEFTENFLRYNKQYTIKGFDYSYKHESAVLEKELYYKIKQQFENAWKEPYEENPNYAIYRYFLKDIELYNTVIKKFNPQGQDWPHISWLQGN